MKKMSETERKIKKTSTKKVGRPSRYTNAIADEICKRISEGEMLMNIVLKKGMPDRRTVYDWMERNPEFAHNYARACELGAHALVEQGISILDNSDPDRAHVDRNRADYRKWLASKRNPESYGDRHALELSGKNGNPVEVNQQTSLSPEQFAVLNDQQSRVLDQIREKMKE